MAEQGQPVWVGAARQQFRGAFSPHGPRYARTPARNGGGSERTVTASGSPRPDGGAKRNSSAKAAIQVLDHAAGTHHLPQQLLHGLAYHAVPRAPAGPTTPARVATAPAAGSVGSAARRGLLRPAWPEPRTPLPTPGDPRRVVSRRPARRPVDSPTDSGPVECGGGSAARAAAVPPRPSHTGHSGRRSRGRARQHVVLEPTDQQGHVFGEGHRLRLGLASIAELPYQRRILAALPVLGAGLAVFQTTACGDGFVGTILQVTDQGSCRL